MTSPSLELQQIIVPDLKAQSSIIALIGDRIYDNVPAQPVFPYVSFGPETQDPDDAQCIRGIGITVQFDVWSREPSSAQCKKIVDAIKRRIESTNYVLPDNANVGLGDVLLIQVFRDSDGRTWHGVMQVLFEVEQA